MGGSSSKRQVARANSIHNEEGGFHLLEVNSPINISGTTWLLIIVFLGVVFACFYYQYRQHQRQERRLDARDRQAALPDRQASPPASSPAYADPPRHHRHYDVPPPPQLSSIDHLLYPLLHSLSTRPASSPSGCCCASLRASHSPCCHSLQQPPVPVHCLPPHTGLPTTPALLSPPPCRPTYHASTQTSLPKYHETKQSSSECVTPPEQSDCSFIPSFKPSDFDLETPKGSISDPVQRLQKWSPVI